MIRVRPPEEYLSDLEQEANNIMIRVGQLITGRTVLLATRIKGSKLLSPEQNDRISASAQKEINLLSARLRELADAMQQPSDTNAEMGS